jgi:hypothetical protein
LGTEKIALEARKFETVEQLQGIINDWTALEKKQRDIGNIEGADYAKEKITEMNKKMASVLGEPSSTPEEQRIEQLEASARAETFLGQNDMTANKWQSAQTHFLQEQLHVPVALALGKGHCRHIP